MEENKRPRWLLPVGIGCLVLLCLCILLFGGFYFLGDRISDGLGGFDIPGMPGDLDDFLETGELPLPPSDLPVEPDTPDQPQDDPPADPPPSDSVPNSPQLSDETEFFDDFSSDAFDWALVDDGKIVLKYENQAYSMEIYEPDYLDGVFLPTLFDPTTIRFDVWGPPGEQGGTIGVECRVQLQGDTLTDYYYVEFDLYYQSVYVGGVMNEEYVEFLSDGGLLLQNITSNPDQVNTIEVGCNPDTILVWVNGILEHDITVPGEYILNSSGPTTFFMYTYEDTMAGYKVFFDNVSAWP